MSGFPRDLAAVDPWEASLARSHARRERADKRAARSPMRLAGLMDARNRLPSPRNLAESEPWDLSTLRSRTRRRATELQFVPTSTRARRVSLGTLIAIAAGPAAGLTDASGSPNAAAPPAPEPPTTAEHHIQLESGSEGRQVRILQHALGIEVDGVFGPGTEAAVRAFQTAHGLIVDGVVGPQTSAALAGAPTIASAAVSATETVAAMTAAHEASAAEPSKSTGTKSSGTPATDPIVRLQEALGVQVDGTFGPETERAVRHLQALHHLHVDGVVGGQTWGALGIREHATLHPAHPSRHSHARRAGASTQAGSAASASTHSSGSSSRSDAVRRLQEALHLEADGNFGPETEAAVKRMQARHGLNVDGVVGPETWSALGIGESTTLHPPHASSKSSGSSSSTGGGGEGSSVVARVIAAADEIATRPYVYGGGHGSFQSTGYDCSGSVSYALHGGGLLSSPEDSGALESYGEPGPGSHITIYANSEHAWMVVDGRRFDTIAQQETGTRWSDSMGSTAGYVVRHPAGL
ncbi:MAG TPA: peptidoglycan-binding protein [Solirubrobacteraceae bacterium]|jgi:peptidoglycan hydrolase-like protein with peptidoglycan-binding domain|nr:peptidoglycan-binding protein [Solirubrobacteraceae bacterium]